MDAIDPRTRLPGLRAMRAPFRHDMAVIDTNIVKMMAEPNRNLTARAFYRERLKDKDLRVSFMTVHEVLWGIENAGYGRRRRRELLDVVYQYPVVRATDRVIAISAHLRHLLRSRQPSMQDLFVASSALALGCPLVTDDRKLVEALTEVGLTGVISRFASGA